MPPQTGTIVIPRDIGAEWEVEQFEQLVRDLALRLNQPVTLVFPEEISAQFAIRVQAMVDSEITRLVIVPLGLLPLPKRGIIAQSIVRAQRRHPKLSVHLAAPLTWLEWSGWLRLTSLDALREFTIRPSEASVLLVGQERGNPLTNANLARLAHLVWETSPLAFVVHAFLDGLRPGIPEAIRILINEGLRHVVVLPWLLDGQALQRLNDVIRECGLNVMVITPRLAHPALVNVLVSNHYAALSDDRFRLPADTDVKLPAENAEGPSKRLSEITTTEALELEELERRLNALLPPEYQGRYEDVRPESMGTAGLKFDCDGKVAWDEIWTSFCDLALAGGPPHRGTLLEAVTSAEAVAEPEKYSAVAAEIERGIQMVTALPVVASRMPGWVGVRCESEEMAIWIMRAIIVENIMVRREREVIYLPAGPRFTIEREIKNVVTAVAKTIHYWTAHLNASRRSADY